MSVKQANGAKVQATVFFNELAGSLGGRPISLKAAATEPDPIGNLVIMALSLAPEKPDSLQSFKQGALAWRIESDMQESKATELSLDDIRLIRDLAVRALAPPAYHRVRMFIGDAPRTELE